MEQETMDITYPEKDIENIIRTYFGDALRELNVTMVGRIAQVNITYEDFKSKRTVRRELEDKITNIEIGCLERIFSNEVTLNLLDEIFESDIEIYVKESNGELRKTYIPLFFEELLYHRSFQN